MSENLYDGYCHQRCRADEQNGLYECFQYEM